MRQETVRVMSRTVRPAGHRAGYGQNKQKKCLLSPVSSSHNSTGAGLPVLQSVHDWLGVCRCELLLPPVSVLVSVVPVSCLPPLTALTSHSDSLPGHVTSLL